MSQMLVVGSRWCVWKWGWRCQGDLGRTPRASAVLPYSKSECSCTKNALVASMTSYSHSFYPFFIGNIPFHVKVLSSLLVSIHHKRWPIRFLFIRQDTQFCFWPWLNCSFFVWSILQSFKRVHALFATWSFITENTVDVLTLYQISYMFFYRLYLPETVLTPVE